LLAIARAGIDGASAATALSRALTDTDLFNELHTAPIHVIAAGKAAATMANAWFGISDLHTRSALAVGTYRDQPLPNNVEWHHAGHPVPDERSVAAASRALQRARAIAADEWLVVLLSGGASALLAKPMDGVTLDDKQRVVRAMLRGGADIHALNTVRKHLSAVKGGRLGAACAGHTITLAISDVVGDDLATIGSGPAVPDPSTWAQAAAALDRYVPTGDQPSSVKAAIAQGLSGSLAETPKPGSPSMRHVRSRVIASRVDAMRGARAAAEQRGYRAVVIDEAITGEARVAARSWIADALTRSAGAAEVCVISSGETTVHVCGQGRGGRNQEFALAIADVLEAHTTAVAVGSVGTDGIDGPTDAAGAVVDSTTLARARDLGLAAPTAYLAENNSYAFFSATGDLIHTGPTGTNVGDLQILLTS
jgi:glycerate 2-kinase